MEKRIKRLAIVSSKLMEGGNSGNPPLTLEQLGNLGWLGRQFIRLASMEVSSELASANSSQQIKAQSDKELSDEKFAPLKIYKDSGETDEVAIGSDEFREIRHSIAVIRLNVLREEIDVSRAQLYEKEMEKISNYYFVFKSDVAHTVVHEGPQELSDILIGLWVATAGIKNPTEPVKCLWWPREDAARVLLTDPSSAAIVKQQKHHTILGKSVTKWRVLVSDAQSFFQDTQELGDGYFDTKTVDITDPSATVVPDDSGTHISGTQTTGSQAAGSPSAGSQSAQGAAFPYVPAQGNLLPYQDLGGIYKLPDYPSTGSDKIHQYCNKVKMTTVKGGKGVPQNYQEVAPQNPCRFPLSRVRGLMSYDAVSKNPSDLFAVIGGKFGNTGVTNAVVARLGVDIATKGNNSSNSTMLSDINNPEVVTLTWGALTGQHYHTVYFASKDDAADAALTQFDSKEENSVYFVDTQGTYPTPIVTKRNASYGGTVRMTSTRGLRVVQCDGNKKSWDYVARDGSNRKAIMSSSFSDIPGHEYGFYKIQVQGATRELTAYICATPEGKWGICKDTY